MHKRINFHLGNLLLILSIIGFVYTLYPLIQIYFFPPALKQIQLQKGTFLTIPKIAAQSSIIENVNPRNETEYNQALKKGIAHAHGSSLPGKNGTIFLFAHSSGSPWEITRQNTIFLRLDELQKHDAIDITKDGKKFEYIVREKKEVWPNEVNYLLQTSRNQLILQTCVPIGTSLKRLLIFAEPVF